MVPVIPAVSVTQEYLKCSWYTVDSNHSYSSTWLFNWATARFVTNLNISDAAQTLWTVRANLPDILLLLTPSVGDHGARKYG